MNKIHVLLASLAVCLAVCSVKSVALGEDGENVVCARQSILDHLNLFDRSMDTSYLDHVLAELAGMKDHDERGNPCPEVRTYKLQTYFHVFRMETEAIDVNYLPGMMRARMKPQDGRLPEKEPRPIPEKVASPYLYDYLQSGLRILRFQTRLAIMDYIRSAYRGIPSPEERKEILLLAKGVDEEFLAVLRDWTLTDVSWVPDKGFKRLSKGTQEERVAEMVGCLKYLHFLEYGRDPLYLEDYGSMNISPPMPVGRDGIMVAGQDPESVKEPESRRQYLIARRENGRKSRGIELWRGVEDKIKKTGYRVFTMMESYRCVDRAGRKKIMQAAEELGMNADFLDNLRDACAGRDIAEAIKRFEKTKDRQDMAAADKLIETFRPCRKTLWGKDSSTFFQLERWLELNHAVATKTEWPDGAQVREELEKKMLENIWRVCGDSRYRLREARWWLRAYGLKSAASRVHSKWLLILSAEEKRVEELLLVLEKDFSMEALKKADHLIDAMTHHDYQQHKIMPDILDFKFRSWFTLMKILEGKLDLSQGNGLRDSLIFPAIAGKVESGDDQDRQRDLREFHGDRRMRLESMIQSDYDDTPETQRLALTLLKEMGVRPEFLDSCRHGFDERNLGAALQKLEEKGKGDPEKIMKDIQAWAKDEKENSEWPYKVLIKKMSKQFFLLKAMHKGGNLGPEGFEQDFRESMMAEINEALPNDWTGFITLENLLLPARNSPLEPALRNLLEERKNAKIAVFNEQLALFEESGDLESLNKASEAMSYMRRNRDEGEKKRMAQRETMDAYLRVLRALDRFRPEDLAGRQKLPPSQWGRNWNDKLSPVQKMELVLGNWKDSVRSRLFSHLRYNYGKSSEEREEVRQLVRNYGMGDKFLKEVEERLEGGK